MNLTNEQQAILEAFATEKDGVVNAFAGTGKSSTLVEMAKSTDRRGIVITYNKDAQVDMTAKLKKAGIKHVTARTAHSLAYASHGVPMQHRLNGPRVTSRDAARILGITQTLSLGQIDGEDASLEREDIARLAQQAVRYFCHSADETISAKHIPTVPGTEDQRDKIVAAVLPYAIKAWADINNSRGRLRFEHDFYLKQWALTRPVIRVQWIAVDECFPAGTKVQTDIGEVPIERIAEERRDWQVLSRSQDGMLSLSYVTSAYRTPRRNRLISIKHEYGTLVCTANHPIWVYREGNSTGAWIAAGLVREGDSVSYLRSTDQSKESKLLSVMCDQVSVCTTVGSGGAGTTGQDLNSNESSTHGDTQSDGKSGNGCESISYIETNRTRPQDSRRKWNGSNSMRTDALRSADELQRAAMEPRLCHSVWRRDTKTGDANANTLQTGSCMSSVVGGGRSGRDFPSGAQTQRAGYSQNSMVICSRVEGVSFYQSSGEGQPDEGGAGDYVFTLSVEAGSYIADGILVKNCQDADPVIATVIGEQRCQKVMVGDKFQQLYQWRHAINAMDGFDCDWNLPLTQSWRFGQALADEANKWLSLLGAKDFLRGNPTIETTLEALDNPSAILCRTNATCIAMALAAIEKGQKVALAGGVKKVRPLRDFILGANDLLSGKHSSHPDLVAFANWDEVEAYSKQDEGSDLRVWVRLINTYGVGELLDVCDQLGKEEDADVVISTGHSAKGREWSTVLIADDFKAPEEDKPLSASEAMLLYVSVTRARHILDCSAVSWIDNLIPTLV